MDGNCLILLPHTRSIRSVFDLHRLQVLTMCIADTRTARVARSTRAVRNDANATPAFAVVAPAKRFDATEDDAR